VAFRNSSSLRWKTFIQSISMESVDKQFIGLHLKQSGITNKTLRLEFLSPNNQSRIRYLQVTVIIFDTNSPGVYFAEGEIAQNFLVSKLDIAIPRHGVNELRTYIVGISSFYFSIAQPINLLAEVNDKFSLVIGPLNGCEIDFVAVSYLILSVVDCGYCTGHPFSFNSTCLGPMPSRHSPQELPMPPCRLRQRLHPKLAQPMRPVLPHKPTIHPRPMPMSLTSLPHQQHMPILPLRHLLQLQNPRMFFSLRS
jgi:hypothetical protein